MCEYRGYREMWELVMDWLDTMPDCMNVRSMKADLERYVRDRGKSPDVEPL